MRRGPGAGGLGGPGGTVVVVGAVYAGAVEAGGAGLGVVRCGAALAARPGASTAPRAAEPAVKATTKPSITHGIALRCMCLSYSRPTVVGTRREVDRLRR